MSTATLLLIDVQRNMLLPPQPVPAAPIVGMQSEYCARETSLAALQRGLAALLVRGAHATYGDGKRSAAEIAAAAEDELAQAGMRILDADDVTF